MYYPPFLSVLLSGIVALVLGYIWYHPKVFGSAWKRDEGLSDDAMRRGGTPRKVLSIVGALLSGMLTAFVMSYFLVAWAVFDAVGSVEVAVWLWVGFVVPVVISEFLFEMRPLRLFFIKGGYYLVLFIMTGILLMTLNPFFESVTPQAELPAVQGQE